MTKLLCGIILILMMLGHNYVINQPQSLQKQLQNIHGINVTQFNLLYSIPSILALLTIIPIGYMYHKYPNFTLLFGIGVLFMGQLLVSMFGAEGKKYFYGVLIAGRTLEGTGAEILYMIQGNLASSWMSHLAGLIFILPEIGQIMNAFFTPFAAITWGVRTSLWLGLIFCAISAIACCYLYCHLKRIQKIKNQKLQMYDNNLTKQQEHANDSDRQTNQSDNIKNTKYNTYLTSDDQISIQKQPQQQQKQQNNSNNNKNKDNNINTKQDRSNNNSHSISQPKSIYEAGVIFWLTIMICAINQCLYFPFLDNANELIQTRFKIPYEDTGYYLCLPFIAAIITTIIMSRLLLYFPRPLLIFYTSLLPFIGHIIIVLIPNSPIQTISFYYKLILSVGFFIFGTGIGGYYSISFPAVGLAVPSQIRGLAYGILCFFQTLAMSLIPILSGLIIEEDEMDQITGYTNNSYMFVVITAGGILIAYFIKKYANSTSYIYDDEDSSSEENLGLIQSVKEKSSENLNFNKKSLQSIQLQHQSKTINNDQ